MSVIDSAGSKEDKFVVCYFTNYAGYRDGIAKFSPSNIDPSLCTHINYAFTSLNETTLELVSSDPWTDIDKKLFEKVTSLGVKVLLSLGGWGDSEGDKYIRLWSNETAIENFIAKTVEFMEKYKFHGLDMDVEYPACPQGKDSETAASDKYNFNKFLQRLKAAFGEKYLLTAAVPGGYGIINKCFDMPTVCGIVDWINIMGYDYHSAADGETGANGPICGTKDSWGVYNTVKYYKETLKCSPDKILLGLPFYGKSFTLAKPFTAGFGEPVTGPGRAGPYIKAEGSLSYYEICLKVKEGYATGNNAINGSYAYKENQFISYDQQVDIIRKVSLVKQFGLKGCMFWTIDFDDFNNLCGCGNYPLLKTLNKHLRCLDISVAKCL